MAILDELGRLYDCFEPEGFERFVVDDLLQGDDLEVVLLFESPHRDELRERIPLVGKTGRSVTKLLNALVLQIICPMRPPVEGKAIGHLCGRPDTGFGWLGLMNACRVPLQKKAYDDNPELQRRCPQLIEDLQAFKDKLDKDDEANIVHCNLGRAIAKDLAERLAPVRKRGLLLVPCGGVARALCAAAEVNVDSRLPRVPHPEAPGAWGHAPALVEMARVIQSVLAE